MSLPMCDECKTNQWVQLKTGADLYHHKHKCAADMFYVCSCGAYCRQNVKTGCSVGLPISRATYDNRAKLYDDIQHLSQVYSLIKGVGFPVARGRIYTLIARRMFKGRYVLTLKFLTSNQTNVARKIVTEILEEITSAKN